MPVQRGFKFEAMWLRADDYRETVEQAWEYEGTVLCPYNPPGQI